MNTKRDTVEIIDKNMCYGCTNCAVICNRNAINIEINKDGFLEPAIDYNLCNRCGSCLDICPVQSNITEDITNYDVYALWSRTDNLRLLATSGGIASSISFKLLDNNYITIGAVYNSDFKKVYHNYCDTPDKIFSTIGSKYVQSNFSVGFREVLKDRNNKFILIGTPCQIAGARNVLARKNISDENYYLIDFFCHGVPSYLLWWSFIENLNRKIGNINSLNLRFKDNDWHNFKIRAIGENKVYLREFSKDTFGKLYLSDYCLRNSCYTCKYSKYSAADLRIGDFWGEHFEGNKMGVSIALPITQKGFDLIVKVDDIEVESVPSSYLYSSQTVKEGRRFNVPVKNDKVMEDLKNGLSIRLIYKKYLLRSEIGNSIKRLPVKLIKAVLPKKYIRFVKKF